MRKINVGQLIDHSRWNGWFFALFSLGLLSIIFDSYDTQTYGVALPVMGKDLGLGPATLGLLASLSMWSNGLGSIMMGVLADRLGAKNVLVLGILVYTFFTGMSGVVTDVGQFAILRFVSGFGLAAMTPIVSTILSEYSPKKIRSQVVANVCLGFTAGQLISIAAGIFLLAAFSWRIMYWPSGPTSSAQTPWPATSSAARPTRSARSSTRSTPPSCPSRTTTMRSARSTASA
jgi:AAHS family benzoate transporter-like MFS transporter